MYIIYNYVIISIFITYININIIRVIVSLTNYIIKAVISNENKKCIFHYEIVFLDISNNY